MKMFSHKKGWNSGMTQALMVPPPIPLIKGTYDGQPDKDIVKLKLRRDPTSSTSDIYEFSMSLFENGDMEEFLLFVSNFNTTVAALGTLETCTNIQYLHPIFHGEELRKFDSLSADVESTEPLNMEYIIKGLTFYFPLVNFL